MSVIFVSNLLLWYLFWVVGKILLMKVCCEVVRLIWVVLLFFVFVLIFMEIIKNVIISRIIFGFINFLFKF